MLSSNDSWSLYSIFYLDKRIPSILACFTCIKISLMAQQHGTLDFSSAFSKHANDHLWQTSIDLLLDSGNDASKYVLFWTCIEKFNLNSSRRLHFYDELHSFLNQFHYTFAVKVLIVHICAILLFHFRNDHIRFFCFQVIEYYLKTR